MMMEEDGDGAPASLQSNVHVICTVWSTIEPYLDLSDTVRISLMTSKIIREDTRNLVIDEDTGRIKISDFSFRRRTRLRQRTPCFLLGALNSIHFPSLRKMHLDLSAIRAAGMSDNDHRAHEEARKTAAATCFPVFVANLAYAKNLETLIFNADATVNKFGMMEGMFQLFGKNLATCCKRLRELAVVNACLSRGQRGNTAFYCHALTSALTPTLIARKNTLNFFTFWTCGSPVGFTPSRTVMSMEETHNGEVWDYFFRAVLDCRALKKLDLHAKGDSGNDLCCLPGLQPFQNPDSLKKLSLVLEPRNPIVRVPGQMNFFPFAHYFSNCHALDEISLIFNEPLWRENENVESVADLLTNQRNLSSLDLSFGRGDVVDSFGILDMVEDCLRKNQSTLDRLHINGVRGVDANRFYKLLDDLVDAGLHPVGGYSGYNKGLRPGGNIDVKDLGMGRINRP